LILSHYLCITLEKEIQEVKQDYLWSIIFESMHQAAFQFQDPRKENILGSYFFYEEIEGPFQKLWNFIYRGTDSPLVSFWCTSFDNTPLFDCEVSLNEKSIGNWEITITLDDTHLWDNHAKSCFFSFLRAGISLYEFFSPSFISMYWDEEFSSQLLLQVRLKNSKEQLEPLEFCKKSLFGKKLLKLTEIIFLSLTLYRFT
jgi:hypothetical protein